MPRIKFLRPIHNEITVEKGTNLMQALLDAKVPVASSCKGDGVCSKCRLQLIDDSGLNAKMTETEIFLIEKMNIKPGYRIACQVSVEGDLSVDAAYW